VTSGLRLPRWAIRSFSSPLLQLEVSRPQCGIGVYLAMEAEYARQYARATNDQHPATLILYAISVSQVYPVTVEADYRTPTEDLGRDDFGMSQFYGKPLKAKFDAHFVPVRYCGACHPWDGTTSTFQGHSLDYQAATEDHPNPARRPTAHELVLSNGLRCTPVALVEVGPRSTATPSIPQDS
jgi:hypothetical protein